MSRLFIPIILGTSRPKSRSMFVANLIHKVGEYTDDIDSIIIDPAKIKLKYDGNDKENISSHYSNLTKKADGFFIVTPEYNHSFSGSLKRLLDSEFDNYKNKPVILVGVSSGSSGGIRAIEALVNVVRKLGMITTSNDILFPYVQDLFDNKNEIIDEKYIIKIKQAFKQLDWLAKTLKWGREHYK